MDVHTTTGEFNVGKKQKKQEKKKIMKLRMGDWLQHNTEKMKHGPNSDGGRTDLPHAEDHDLAFRGKKV